MKGSTIESLHKCERVGRHWFSPGWTDENEMGALDHGEFQSPVWNCVSLAISSDRERDAALDIRRDITYIPGTMHAERGGDLRALLACVARSRAIEPTVRRDALRAISNGDTPRGFERATHSKDRRVGAKSLATIGLLAAFVVGLRAKRSLGRVAA